MDFDEVADELYGVPPEDFTATRKAREEEARAEGDRVLAKSISQLPKPSLAAWASNLLVREQREQVAGLVELGSLLREAQESLAGDQLKALSVQRNQLLAALSRQVMALARRQGHPISSGVAGQVEDTLRAAMADAEAGEAVLSGRLTAPLSYSGLGTGQRPDLRIVRAPAEAPPAPARRTTAPKTTTAQRTTAEGKKRAAEEKRRREEEAARREAEERRRRELAEAQQAVEEAAQAADDAAQAAEREQAKAEELDSRHRELQQRVDELMDELARTRQETTTVEGQLSRAQRKRTAAARRAEEAVAERDRAAARLEDLRQKR